MLHFRQMENIFFQAVQIRLLNYGTFKQGKKSIPLQDTIQKSPYGKYLLEGGDSSGASLWDIEEKEWVQFFFGHGAGQVYFSPIWDVAFSQSSKYLLTAGGHDKTAKLWKVQPRQSVGGREQSLKTFTGHQEAVLSVAFSPDEQSAL